MAGLPPTPIGAPGQSSLEAALNPADGDWLYYVLADANGGHYFTADYNDFLKAKKRAEQQGLLGRMNLSGATRLAAVIGDPIRHSRSPAIFNAAFAAAGPRLGLPRLRGAERRRGRRRSTPCGRSASTGCR